MKGYSVNVTETNDEDGDLSIITDVQVKPASAADKDYLRTVSKLPWKSPETMQSISMLTVPIKRGQSRIRSRQPDGLCHLRPARKTAPI